MTHRAKILEPADAGGWPDVVVYLQSAVKRVYASESDDYGSQILDSWELSAHRSKGPGDYDDGVRGCGRTRTGLWNHLSRLAADHNSVMILSMDAREQMAVTGLWDGVLAGQLCVGYQPPGVGGVDRRRGDGGKGIVILDACPTIVVFNIAGSECVFTWLDPGNYGASRLWAGVQEAYKPVDWTGRPALECWHSAGSLEAQVRAVCLWHNAYIQSLREICPVTQRWTAAGQARDCYTHSYMTHCITIHDCQPVLDMERDALHGGRNECFYLGDWYNGEPPPPPETPVDDGSPAEMQGDLYGPTAVKGQVDRKWAVRGNGGPVWHLDANSMYPYLARDAVLPRRLDAVIKNLSVKSLLQLVKEKCVIADVRVKVDDPCVPVWMMLGQRWSTVYPVGSVRTTLCGPEILLAAEHGSITACHVAAVYDGAPIYRQWCHKLLSLRQLLTEQRKVEAAYCIKAILNSSFGKWAQRRQRWVNRPEVAAPEPFVAWLDMTRGTTMRAVAWSVQECCDDGEPPDSFPAITSYINSLGRVYLWRLMLAAGRDEVLYCDTDSLFLTDRGYSKLLMLGLAHETEPGKLKHVDCISRLSLMGKRVYECDGTLTVAGVTDPVVSHGDTTCRTVGARGVMSYLWHTESPGTDRVESVHRLRLPYPWGTVQDDGTVRPLIGKS